MRKFLLSLKLVFCTFSAVFAQFSGPESVEYHSPSHTYFVSNTVSHQIIRVWPGGNTSVFATNNQLGNNGPHGIEIVDDTLYACTGGGLRAFKLADSTLLFNINLGASFLNGITHDENGYLFITDFSLADIYRFNTHSRTFNAMLSNIGSTPNGIIYDRYDGLNPRLVFVNWGANAQVKAINLADSTISVLTTTALSNIDGICKGRNGTFYLASWSPDRITAYDSTFAGPPVTIATNVNNPADICYNFDGDTIAVPNSNQNANSVIYIGLTITGEESRADASFNLFPNPASSEVKIALPENSTNCRVILYGSNGSVSAPLNINSDGTLNLSALSSGLYTLEISEAGKLPIRKKLMICH